MNGILQLNLPEPLEEAFIEPGEKILEEAELVGGEDGLVEGIGEVAALVHVEQLHEVADAVDRAGVGTVGMIFSRTNRARMKCANSMKD